MKQALFSTFVVTIFFAHSSFALSGIAVSDCWLSQTPKSFSSIRAHFIENNQWIDSVFIDVAENRQHVRTPSINSYGTHCVYFRRKQSGSGTIWEVVVARINGKDKLKKVLCEFEERPWDNDRNSDGRIWSMMSEWPRGQWVLVH
ncbi:MAG: hypothetical protein GF398_16515 [Chitinivibrionales bacterium]|nr:hypothetical protein [Chitinivibrionales bacterium]